jgi:hypothetical protein
MENKHFVTAFFLILIVFYFKHLQFHCYLLKIINENTKIIIIMNNNNNKKKE